MDTDGDGYGDGIQKLVDNQSSFSLDSTFDDLEFSDAAGTDPTDDSVLHSGDNASTNNGNGGRLSNLTIASSMPGEGPCLFFVKEILDATPGQGTLFKVNIDPDDTDATDANEAYGMTIWRTSASAAEMSYQAPLSWSKSAGYRLFVSCSNDTETTPRLLLAFLMTGNSVPSVSGSWEQTAGTTEDENDKGVTMSIAGSHWNLAVAPSNGRQLFTSEATRGTGLSRTPIPLRAAAGGAGGPVTITVNISDVPFRQRLTYQIASWMGRK